MGETLAGIVMTAVGPTGVGVLIAAVLLVRRKLVVVVVTGKSMRPTLRPGDHVVIRRGVPVTRGSIVVLSRPSGDTRWVIKRAVALPGDPVPQAVLRAVGGATTVPPGRLVVLGDNDYSIDSRLWGFLALEEVLGVVVRRVGRRFHVEG